MKKTTIAAIIVVVIIVIAGYLLYQNQVNIQPEEIKTVIDNEG